MQQTLEITWPTVYEMLSDGGEQNKIFVKDQICSQFSNNYINYR